MQFVKSLLVTQCILFFILNNYVIANPLFGSNIRDARPNEFPFIVSLLRLVNNDPSNNDTHICTGSLITIYHVLTAAHCLEDEIITNVVILVGTHDLRLGTRHTIKWWITYNEWCQYMEIELIFRVNDIAIIRLNRFVSRRLQLGVISSIATSRLYNKNVVIAGWGRNEQSIVPEIMRTVILQVYTAKKCNDIVSRRSGIRMQIHSRHICTYANPYAIAHFGDSGAPILFEGVIVAIHKSTVPFPGDYFNPQKINVHTTIDYYREFVEMTIDPDFCWL